MSTYNRYDNFVDDGMMKFVPFIKIREKTTDKFVYYINGQSRLDLLSYQYYDNPNYGWLILQANPEVGSYEFNIPTNTLLRIPYPLSTTLSQYNDDIALYDAMYGIH